MLHSGETVIRGVRYFNVENPDNPILQTRDRPYRFNLRPVPERAQLRSDSSTMPFHWNSKHRVSEIKSLEYNLDDVMTRKKRINSLDAQRNLIPVRNMGDKPYREPERSTNFCCGEGLIPGASISRHRNKSLLKTEGTVNISGLDKRKLKLNRMALESDLNEVQALTV